MVDIIGCMRVAEEHCRKVEDRIKEVKTFISGCRTEKKDVPDISEYREDFEVYCERAEKGVKETKIYIGAYLAKHKKDG